MKKKQRTHGGRIPVLGAMALTLLACGAEPGRSDAIVNAGSGDWHAPSTWQGGRVPGPNDAVTVNVGNVVLTNDTAALTSFTMTGGTLTLSNWVTRLFADTVQIEGGTVTAAGPFTNSMMSNRVHIVCVDLSVVSPGMIDVTGKGYAGGRQLDTSSSGHGSGRGYGNYEGVGGSHGGVGGGGADLGTTLARMPGYSQPYGEPGSPWNPGSGGGGNKYTGIGGNGGGAVRIAATGTVSVQGAIIADGGHAAYDRGGGGAGGSIYISCESIEGSDGTVQARGGNFQWYINPDAGSGAGGRIAIDYDEEAQAAVPDIRFDVEPGRRHYGLIHPRGEAEPGTLWFPNALFVTETLTRLSGKLVIPGFTEWSPASLTISNCWVRFAADGFRLRVSDNLTIRGVKGAENNSTVRNHGGRLDLGGSGYGETGWISYHRGVSGTTPELFVGGNLTLEPGGDLAVYSAPTNATTDYGALVRVAGNLTVSSNAWIHPWSHPIDGGSPKFVMRTLVVSAGGGFNADFKGFDGLGKDGTGPGKPLVRKGYGGTYGGVGGNTNLNPVLPYDSAEGPRQPGSAGSSSGSGYVIGGSGGGMVWIEAQRDVQLDGMLTARGLQPRMYYALAGTLGCGGGGSGGAILVLCRRFNAGETAALIADGGDGWKPIVDPDPGACGGGGGRIAVWRSSTRTVHPSATISVHGGDALLADGSGPSGDPLRVGGDGTICWGQLPPLGTVLLVR